MVIIITLQGCGLGGEMDSLNLSRREIWDFKGGSSSKRVIAVCLQV